MHGKQRQVTAIFPFHSQQDPYWQKELERILDGVRAFKRGFSEGLWDAPKGPLTLLRHVAKGRSPHLDGPLLSVLSLVVNLEGT